MAVRMLNPNHQITREPNAKNTCLKMFKCPKTNPFQRKGYEFKLSTDFFTYAYETTAGMFW